MKKLEVDAIIGEVARKHNLLVDRDDPALMLVTISEIVLRRIVEEHNDLVAEAQDRVLAGTAERLDAAQEAAREIAGKIITGSAEYVTTQLREAGAGYGHELIAATKAHKADMAAMVATAQHASRSAWWAAVTVLVAAASVAAGIVIGHVIDIPSPVRATPQSTPGIAAWR